jgi:propionyl-CoA:succinyl-CoA transferase
MSGSNKYARLTPEEAAELIPDGSTIGFSGFTSAGSAKVVPRALAKKAKILHSQNKDFKVRILAGASTSNSVDGALAEADAISLRLGYQSTKTMRNKINEETIDFVDIHLSHIQQQVKSGMLGKVDFAVIEATDITDDGKVYLSTSIGASPTYLECADKVIIEINQFHSLRLREMTDIIAIPKPPRRKTIPIFTPMDKIGKPYANVDPNKIVGIVYNDEPDETSKFTTPDETCAKISINVVNFLLNELKADRIPKEFLPLQSGVGNIGNAVMKGIGEHPDIPPFTMFTEVFQDSLVEQLEKGNLLGASTSALTISSENLKKIYSNMDFFAPRLVLRPQEISNNPILTRQLGVISINTALEADIYGNINSTHVCGTKIMNGIGGSGDFERNAYLSIFVCPSIAKAGKISAIVPMCTHIDSSEHSVEILITEQGTADLRGLSPLKRAYAIIKNCIHPAYRDYMYQYLASAPKGHIRHNLSTCFDLHKNLIKHGAMLPNVRDIGL